jgi:ribosomal protein S18 acetylase RimI-like enzyme
VPVRLRPLRDDEFGPFIEHGIAGYAQDMVEHAGLTPEQAQKKSDTDWAKLLPNGRASKGHYLFAVEDQETGERVGDLWFAERTNDFDSTVAFVYSIEIFEGFRGRGFGKQAMLLLEEEVRALGLDHVALNVFGGNEVARSLYRSLGYAETAVWMRKQISEPRD